MCAPALLAVKRRGDLVAAAIGWLQLLVRVDSARLNRFSRWVIAQRVRGRYSRLGKIKEVRLLGDGIAWSTGVSEFTINGKDGTAMRARGNWMDILKRDGKEWRVSFQAFARTPCSP